MTNYEEELDEKKDRALTDKEIYKRLSAEIDATHDEIMNILTGTGVNSTTAAVIDELAEAIGEMINSRKKVESKCIPFNEFNSEDLPECEGVINIQAKQAETEDEKTKKANVEILHFTLTVLLSALVAFIVASLALR